MNERMKPELLTTQQKMLVYGVIYQNMQLDDRWPCEVIADCYEGDEERYLADMVWWHGIII